MTEHRTTVTAGAGMDFVISDGSLDAHGTRFNPEGWELNRFRRNPIALFNHNPSFVVGRWENVRSVKGQLIGTLRLAAKGTSDRIDELIRLVEQGILRAVSVGFCPLLMGDPKRGGFDFERTELREASLVSVPSNSNALAMARSLHVSDDTLDLVFGKHADGDEDGAGRGTFGKYAAIETANEKRARVALPSLPKAPTMEKTLSRRIEDADQRLVALRDQLTDHLNGIGDEPDEAMLLVTEEMNGKIAAQERSVASLKEAEARLAATSEPARAADPRRPLVPAAVAPKVEPKSYAYRAATIALLAHARKQPIDAVRQEIFGDDEPTRVVTQVLTRAASAPATTTQNGWAAQLVQTVNADFLEDLVPTSIYPGLSARGLRLTFGRNGAITIPSRQPTPTIAGSFVGESAPIPVRQGALTSQTLGPKKMAVISTFSREISEHSVPAIEGLIRAFMQEDTAVAIDTVLLDANAATSIRPAGLRNGVTGITATSGGGFAALVADVKALVGALITSTGGNVRQPVWLMNPVNVISASLTQNAGGEFSFQQELNAGNFQGFPVIQSASVPVGLVMLVDAADFVSVTGDEPRFDLSDQATLHMEDTAPAQIGTAGTPNVVAAPVRSMFQTDSIAIRMILPMNWALRRAGVVAFVNGVTW